MLSFASMIITSPRLWFTMLMFIHKTVTIYSYLMNAEYLSPSSNIKSKYDTIYGNQWKIPENDVYDKNMIEYNKILKKILNNKTANGSLKPQYFLLKSIADSTEQSYTYNQPNVHLNYNSENNYPSILKDIYQFKVSYDPDWNYYPRQTNNILQKRMTHKGPSNIAKIIYTRDEESFGNKNQIYKKSIEEQNKRKNKRERLIQKLITKMYKTKHNLLKYNNIFANGLKYMSNIETPNYEYYYYESPNENLLFNTNLELVTVGEPNPILYTEATNNLETNYYPNSPYEAAANDNIYFVEVEYDNQLITEPNTIQNIYSFPIEQETIIQPNMMVKSTDINKGEIRDKEMEKNNQGDLFENLAREKNDINERDKEPIEKYKNYTKINFANDKQNHITENKNGDGKKKGGNLENKIFKKQSLMSRIKNDQVKNMNGSDLLYENKNKTNEMNRTDIESLWNRVLINETELDEPNYFSLPLNTRKFRNGTSILLLALLNGIDDRNVEQEEKTIWNSKSNLWFLISFIRDIEIIQPVYMIKMAMGSPSFVPDNVDYNYNNYFNNSDSPNNFIYEQNDEGNYNKTNLVDEMYDAKPETYLDNFLNYLHEFPSSMSRNLTEYYNLNSLTRDNGSYFSYSE